MVKKRKQKEILIAAKDKAIAIIDSAKRRCDCAAFIRFVWDCAICLI